MPAAAGRPRWTDHAVGALNGALGDYLSARKNGLAQSLAVYQDYAPVPLTEAAVARAFPHATPRLLVLVHGLACTEALWGFPKDPSTTYGSLAARDVGATPIYVRYNTGRRLEENGADLAALLEALLAVYPVPVQRIDLVGHSMGGLVLRSACHEASRLGHEWLRHVRSAFYLGSPHLGAPLEKLATVVTRVLRSVPDPTTRTLGEVLAGRSAGVRDLGGAEALWPIGPTAGIEHHLFVGTLTQKERHWLAWALGDGLVRTSSAACRPDEGCPAVTFPEGDVRTFPGKNHLALARDPDVYAALVALLKEEASCNSGEG